MIKIIIFILISTISTTHIFADDTIAPSYPVGCINSSGCQFFGLPNNGLSNASPNVLLNYTVLIENINSSDSFPNNLSNIIPNNVKPGSGWLELNIDPLIQSLFPNNLSNIIPNNVKPGSGWLELNIDPLIQSLFPNNLLLILARSQLLFSPGDIKVVYDKGFMGPLMTNITGNGDTLVVNSQNLESKELLEKSGITQVRASALKINDNSLFNGMSFIYRVSGKLVGIGW